MSLTRNVNIGCFFKRNFWCTAFMGILYQWRYKTVFGLIIAYTCIVCFIACSLLWNIATGNPPADFDDSVSTCAIDSQLFDPRHDCSLIGQLAGKKFISNGWTKVVHRASLPGGLYVAVKTVHSNGKDVTECLRTEPYYVCYNKATDKLMREIDLLKSLQHEAIISLKYYCIKRIGNHTCMKHSAIVTEFGEPLTNIKLLQMVWRERRQLIQDLAKLVDYVSNSPIGALGLTDLRRPQCVLINNRLKLTDLDDIAVKDPYCKTNADCSGSIFACL